MSRRFPRLTRRLGRCNLLLVSTLLEIERAANGLAPEEKQKLILFLAAQIREDASGAPPLRSFTKEQMTSWIEQDEFDLEQFRRGQ